MGGMGWMTGCLAAVLFAAPLMAQDADRVVKTSQSTELRAGANENYKATETLEAGRLLVVVQERAGWYEVEVPGGFECYVHSDYVELDDEGHGAVLGDNVNLRAIATSSNNYPITRVQRGDRLRVLEKEGDWLHVLSPASAKAWVLASKAEAVGTRGEMTAELEAARQERDRVWREESVLAKQAAARREAVETMTSQIDALETQVRAALTNPEGVDFGPWRQEAATIRDSAGDNTVLRDRAVKVLADIAAFEGSRDQIEEEARKRRELQRDKEELENRLREKREEIESIANQETPEAEPIKPSRFDAIGWIKPVPKGLLGSSTLYPHQLTRAEGTQFYLHSASGRGQKAKFRLEDYENCLVGIRGKIRNTGGITYRVLIIDHLEVLSTR
ncbi:MAG: SH3 domain-containing protein [Planctomycetota bacterium]